MVMRLKRKESSILSSGHVKPLQILLRHITSWRRFFPGCRKLPPDVGSEMRLAVPEAKNYFFTRTESDILRVKARRKIQALARAVNGGRHTSLIRHPGATGSNQCSTPGSGKCERPS